MKQTIRSFVGMDVHKETISISVAEDGRSGTVRFIGVIPNTPEAAPSMIPRKPGERIKTDRRDSEKLAILHRHGDLTPVWVPDTTHEALRDLVRARVTAPSDGLPRSRSLRAFQRRNDSTGWHHQDR